MNSHGTGTAKNDPAETAATKVGLGEEAAYNTVVSSTKSMIGHLLGGAGAAEAIVVVKAIEDQVAPPTANFTEPDPECDLDYVPNDARELSIDFALSNNFAFGGANASVLFMRPGARAGAAGEGGGRGRDHRYRGAHAGRHRPGRALERLPRRAMRDRRGRRERGAGGLHPGDFLTPKERKRVDRLGLFSVIGSRLALEDAGIELTDDSRERVGDDRRHRRGPDGEHGSLRRRRDRGGRERGEAGRVPQHHLQRRRCAGGHQERDHRLHVDGHGRPRGGRLVARVRGPAGGHRSRGAVVCLGADALTDTVLDAYRRLGVVAGSSNGGGFALAEAGLALVTERLGKAKARGARIYGRVLGYAITSD